MQKSKIEWTDYTWNPIRGLCPVDCKLLDGRSYCYARRMYQRFKWNPKVTLDGELFGSCQDAFAPNINVYEKLGRIKSGSKIFICSTFELFHPQVPKKWENAIFQAIKSNPQHTFQILTKFPQNIDRPMPDNVYLGVSITKQKEMWRLGKLEEAQSKMKFISFEPLLSPINLKAVFDRAYESIDWIIVGRLTGFGKKHDPHEDWIREFIELIPLRIKIFLKDNLKEIWTAKLIQEFPDVAIRKHISTKYKFIGGKDNELSE